MKKKKSVLFLRENWELSTNLSFHIWKMSWQTEKETMKISVPDQHTKANLPTPSYFLQHLTTDSLVSYFSKLCPSLFRAWSILNASEEHPMLHKARHEGKIPRWLRSILNSILSHFNSSCYQTLSCELKINPLLRLLIFIN